MTKSNLFNRRKFLGFVGTAMTAAAAPRLRPAFAAETAAVPDWTIGPLVKQKEPILRPEYEWEKKGFTGNTTVANGLVPFRGKWMLYYGAADRVIGLATCEME